MRMIDEARMKKRQAIFGKVGLSFQVVKTAVAASLSWAIVHDALGSTNPVFAPLAAMLVIQVAIFDTIERALYRILGTIGGVVIGMLISIFIQVNFLSIGLVILLSFALTRSLRFPAYLITQVAISSLLVLFFSHNLGTVYIWARIIDTMVGAVVACIINILVLPPNPVPKLKEMIHKVTSDIGEILHQLSIDIEHKEHYQALLKVRQLVPHVEEINTSIFQAKKSLRYSPLQKKSLKAMDGLNPVIETLERVVIQCRGIVRSLLDISVRSEHLDSFQPILTELMKVVILFGSYVKEPAKPALYLLQEAIQNGKAVHQKRYTQREKNTEYTVSLNIGSIYTDAYRILEEISVFTRVIEDSE